MNTSYSLQFNASELLDIPRKAEFGPLACSKEYRDNYILGNIILRFPLNKIDQLNSYYEEDSNTPKVAKSVSLRADAYDRLKYISCSIGKSESETCRLLIYYFSKNTPITKESNLSPEVEKEMASLRKAIEEANRALISLEKLLK